MVLANKGKQINHKVRCTCVTNQLQVIKKLEFDACALMFYLDVGSVHTHSYDFSWLKFLDRFLLEG